MRILAISNLYPNPVQPERAPFNRQQFQALAREHELRVIAPIAWTSFHAASAVGKERRVVDGIEVSHPRYLYTPKAMRSWYGHFLRASIRGAFIDALREFRPEVVLGAWAYPDGWAAVTLAREAGLPVVVKVHGSDVHSLDLASRRAGRTADALKGADAVVAVSEELRHRCVALGAESSCVHVVRNGIDRERFAPGDRLHARKALGIDPDAYLVLAVCNLVPVKGLDILLQALSELNARGVSYASHVLGAGPLRSSLADEARQRGLNVNFMGSRPHDELPDWYRAADVVVLPSRAEGIPNVLLEASACGTPWIASAVGGIPEIAAGEMLVPVGDPEALADALAATAARQTGSVPRRTAKSEARSWDDSARDLATVLERVVQQAGRCSTGVRSAA
jgi:glycosyltransferase involved in cell wall biosynthesis